MKPPGILDQLAAWTLNIIVVGVLLPVRGAGTALSLCLLAIASTCVIGIGLSMWVYRGRLSCEQDERRRGFLRCMPLWLLPLGGGLIFVVWQALDAIPYRRWVVLEQFYAELIGR